MPTFLLSQSAWSAQVQFNDSHFMIWRMGSDGGSHIVFSMQRGGASVAITGEESLKLAHQLKEYWAERRSLESLREELEGVLASAT